MGTSVTFDLRIIPFCSCEGCIRAVRIALDNSYDVKISKIDYLNGTVTIISNSMHPPEVIRFALEKKLYRKSVILSGIINHNLAPRNYSPGEGNLSVTEMAQAVVTLSNAPGLRNVEYTPNRLRINYYDQTQPNMPRPGTENIGYGYIPTPPPPQPPLQVYTPSAPPFPSAQNQVIGYPVEDQNDFPISFNLMQLFIVAVVILLYVLGSGDS